MTWNAYFFDFFILIFFVWLLDFVSVKTINILKWFSIFQEL